MQRGGQNSQSKAETNSFLLLTIKLQSTMTEINFKLVVPSGRESEFFATLSGLFGGKVTAHVPAPEDLARTEQPEIIEKAVKKEPPAEKVEKAVKKEPAKKAEAAEEKTTEAPSYSIETVRAKAKEVASAKGNGFIKQCLVKVGATSVSAIEEEKYGEFMALLSAK